MGEYANLMVRDYDAALQYVQDYFQMDYKRFVSKYFKGNRVQMRSMFHFTERRIEAHVCICFIAYKVYKELERLIAINKIGMSVDKVLEAAKTITTIRVRMPENGTYFTKTLFLTEKHLAVKPLFDISGNKS